VRHHEPLTLKNDDRLCVLCQHSTADTVHASLVRRAWLWSVRNPAMMASLTCWVGVTVLLVTEWWRSR